MWAYLLAVLHTAKGLVGSVFESYDLLQKALDKFHLQQRLERLFHFTIPTIPEWLLIGGGIILLVWAGFDVNSETEMRLTDTTLQLSELRSENANLRRTNDSLNSAAIGFMARIGSLGQQPSWAEQQDKTTNDRSLPHRRGPCQTKCLGHPAQAGVVPSGK